MAYRQDYLIEHGFARYKEKALGLTPIYLSSTTRIKGLVRLLSIGLQILCLLEFSVREALQQKQEKLSEIYKGNPKRATIKPTAEMSRCRRRMMDIIAGLCGGQILQQLGNTKNFCSTLLMQAGTNKRPLMRPPYPAVNSSEYYTLARLMGWVCLHKFCKIEVFV